MCAENNPSHWPFELRMKPPLGGLRILSLDGGGVRGIVELITLRRLLSATGLSLNICDLFDLIVGTSAGKWGPKSIVIAERTVNSPIRRRNDRPWAWGASVVN